MLWDFEKNRQFYIIDVIWLFPPTYQFSKTFLGRKYFFQNLEKQMHHALDDIVLRLHINFQINPIKTRRKKRNKKFLHSA